MNADALLCEAIDTRSPQGVIEALALGANPNTRHFYGRTFKEVPALERAWREQELAEGQDLSEMLVALIQGGAHIIGVSTATQIFNDAWFRGRLPTLQALFSNGYTTQANHPCLFTPHLPVLAYLVNDRDLDPSKTVERRGTPAHHAIKMQWMEHTRFLLDWGVSVEASDHEGNSLLITAAEYAAEEILIELLARGADPSIRNFSGDTALHLAATAEIAELLISAGAPLDVANDRCELPEDTRREWVRAAIEHARLSRTCDPTHHAAPTRRL